jgi:ubiquitin-like protein Pup
MSKQTTKDKQSSTEAPPEKKTEAKDLKNEELDQSTKDVSEAIDKAIAEKDMDDLIEEIDGVLEQNAEEFVKNYVQRGGE